MADRDLIMTGIAGLDHLLLGGVPRGNVILVEGTPGTGKTLLGTEFIYRGITEYNEPGMMVTFEVAPSKLIRDAGMFGWDLEDLQQKNQLKIIFTSPQVLSQEVRSSDSLLMETASEMGAKRIFVDGISLLQQFVNGGAESVNGFASYRQVLQQLIEGFQRENLTAMLSHEVMAGDRQASELSTLNIAEFLTDTVIVLRREEQRRKVHRSLEVIKSRGQDYDAGRHSLRITEGKGLEIFRRVQAPPRDPQKQRQPTSTNRQSVIGLGPLDELFGGGVFDGSVTMLVGVSGSGKTVLGTQLLLEGARRNKRGLMVSLDEHPEQVMRNAETLGLNLRQHLESGMIQFFYDCPREMDVDIHFAHILETIEKHNIERLIIDGMTSYTSALEDQQRYREFFHALVSFSKGRLMTTFLSYENPELFGVTYFMPNFPVSSIVDNIVLMNYVELGNTLHRAITVAKARGSANQFTTREFTIGQGGISLIPVDESLALPVLPFQSYYGLLSRAPTRFSPAGKAPGEPIQRN